MNEVNELNEISYMIQDMMKHALPLNFSESTAFLSFLCLPGHWPKGFGHPAHLQPPLHSGAREPETNKTSFIRVLSGSTSAQSSSKHC